MTTAKAEVPWLENISQRFLEVLEGLQRDEDLLKKKVEDRRQKLIAQGVSKDQIAKKLSRHLVEGAVFRSTTSGVASALPVTLPVIGAIPTFAIVVSANTLYTFKNELELCYLIAYANGTELSSEALQHRAFWLVGLSNFDEVKKQARALGVKVTLKKLVEKLAVTSASRGLAHFLHCGIGASVAINAGTFGFLAGAPISGFYGYRSTTKVAQRAIEYFVH